MSESVQQALIRQYYAQLGVRLWRCNTGVLKDERGVPVRFGLANDSAAVNESLKAGDLIGWRPRLVTPDMVGEQIAQFVSVEVKRQGWKMPGAGPIKRDGKLTAYGHALAQARWARMVLADGGEAGFMIDPNEGFLPL